MLNEEIEHKHKETKEKIGNIIKSERLEELKKELDEELEKIFK